MDFGRQLADLMQGSEPTETPAPAKRIAKVIDPERLRRLTGLAEAAATFGTGLAASVPAGLAGMAQMIPTRGRTPDINKAAQTVEDVQSALTYLPRTPTGQRVLERGAGALEMLGAPAELIGEKTLEYTGSPALATAANVFLDPVNLIGMPGSGKAVAAGTRAAGRAIAAAPRVAGEMLQDLTMGGARPGSMRAQRGAIDLGPQVPEFKPQGFEGLLSRADEALASLPRSKGTGAEFLRELQKAPGVKPAELEDRGLIEALSGMGKVTKADVLKVLQDNPPVKFEEVVLGQGRVKTFEEWAKDKGLTPEAIQDFGPSLRNSYEAFKEAEGARVGGTKYGQYTLPGGENYRELLLTLPSKRPSIKNMGRREYDEAVRRADEQGIRDYTTPHWEQPNVLAHARISDRTGPNGEKILHVEEVQSDWHQTGRKEGYKTGKEKEQISALSKQYDELTNRRRQLLKQAEEMPDGGPEFISLIDESNAITPQLMRLQEQMDSLRSAGERGVPDAPFKKNWHELMMKRLVDYAAKNGYDRIAITPGAEQASRYDLSKHITDLSYKRNDDGTYRLTARDKDGRLRDLGPNNTESQLSSIVGKDIAEKIVKGEGEGYPEGSISQGFKKLSGLDLQVGGEGMKGFYDKILPTYLNELGKPYGVKVGQMEIEAGKEMSRGPTGRSMVPTYAPKTVPVHAFDITPQMREAIKSKGLPLYKKGGSVHISDNPDTMALALQAGGAIKAAAKAAKPSVEQAAKLAEQRAALALRKQAMMELESEQAAKQYFERPEGYGSAENIERRMEEIRQRGMPKKKGGSVKITDNLDTMRLAVQKRK